MSHAIELHLAQGAGPIFRVVPQPEADGDGIQFEIDTPGGRKWLTFTVTAEERDVIARMFERPEQPGTKSGPEEAGPARAMAEWTLDEAWELALRIDQMRTVMTEIRQAFAREALLHGRDANDHGARAHPAYLAARAKIEALQEQLRELD